MDISIGWVRDFVDFDEKDPKEIGNRVTLGTAEVEEVKAVGQHYSQIKVAQIKSIKKHPEADKLNLVTFDFGGKEHKEVVCGAPNVREGLKVPYAPVGLYLPAIDLLLEPKKIRGILSEGMLCSASELGLGNDHSGLLEIEDSVSIGTTMLEYLDENQDVVLDIDNKSLTHRPDLWGHYGFAREFAALFDAELKNPYGKNWQEKLENKCSNDTPPVEVVFEGESAGKCYWGLSVDNVTVKESPKWLVRRLETCGLRSINNIVDISNYVMLELGIPNHIFDREMIRGGKIIIKRAGEKQKFMTLDEIERDLIETDTVVCDTERPLVIGGIMGGLNSGVTEKTTKVFLEVANWAPADVRRVSTRLGLRTDSSQRYEKSLDSQLTQRTLFRLLDILLEVCPEAKVIGQPVYAGEDLSKIPNLKIETSAKSICKQLGKEIPEDKIIDIFSKLDFKVNKNNEKLELSVPSYRATKDVECEADLVEEIGRIIGYDNITPSSPLAAIQTTRFDAAKVLMRKVHNFMITNGRCLEVMTYPMVGEKLLEKSEWPESNDKLSLVNSLSVDHDRMRPSLIPSLLQTISLNQKQFSSFQFFEIGRSYLPGKKSFADERHQLAIVFFDKKKNTFHKTLDVVEDLLNYLNISFDLTENNSKFQNTVIPYEWRGTHPNEYLGVRIMGKYHGALSSIHPIILRNFKIKGNATVAIIDFTDFMNREMKTKFKYKPLPKFPSSHFDCTVVCDERTPITNILEPVKKLKIKELIDTKIVDTFDLGEGKRSITVRSTFLDPAKTLDGETIKNAENNIIATLEKAGYPLKS